ncbi:MAG: phosphatidate cytidylyltransferase [Chloroflexi bacterium]|nr:phosphatidate cytidylyltransferase [Chloroflexota bacterium]
MLRKRGGDLLPRLLGGAIVVAVTVAFVLLGGWWFTLFVTSVVAWTSYELWQLLRRAGHQSSLLITLLTALAAFFTVQPPNLALPIPFLALTLALLVSLAWLLPRVPSRCFADWAVSFAGGFYLGWAGGHLARLMALPPDGRWWLSLALATAWSADSAAYAFGRLFGRHKLAPMISPGKTWEGYIAGVALSTLAGLVIGQLSPLQLIPCLVTGALVGALSIFGDLVESSIKRQAHVKDSGQVIPGHGGVFDRIDSLLWAGVIVFCVAAIELNLPLF